MLRSNESGDLVSRMTKCEGEFFADEPQWRTIYREDNTCWRILLCHFDWCPVGYATGSEVIRQVWAKNPKILAETSFIVSDQDLSEKSNSEILLNI
mmetsp:Transcript_36171/g.73840  ORF Transcript_36171/g.73840 Transcript_36171/m.73840 type:complete len:96 (-) Transcript_36171:101-388(-)